MSYTFTQGSSYTRAARARDSVKRSCNCCSAARVSVKRHPIQCYDHMKGREKVKMFYVPFADRCSCTPCNGD